MICFTSAFFANIEVLPQTNDAIDQCLCSPYQRSCLRSNTYAGIGTRTAFTLPRTINQPRTANTRFKTRHPSISRHVTINAADTCIPYGHIRSRADLVLSGQCRHYRADRKICHFSTARGGIRDRTGFLFAPDRRCCAQCALGCVTWRCFL